MNARTDRKARAMAEIEYSVLKELYDVYSDNSAVYVNMYVILT